MCIERIKTNCGKPKNKLFPMTCHKCVVYAQAGDSGAEECCVFWAFQRCWLCWNYVHGHFCIGWGGASDIQSSALFDSWRNDNYVAEKHSAAIPGVTLFMALGLLHHVRVYHHVNHHDLMVKSHRTTMFDRKIPWNHHVSRKNMEKKNMISPFFDAKFLCKTTRSPSCCSKQTGQQHHRAPAAHGRTETIWQKTC